VEKLHIMRFSFSYSFTIFELWVNERNVLHVLCSSTLESFFFNLKKIINVIDIKFYELE